MEFDCIFVVEVLNEKYVGETENGRVPILTKLSQTERPTQEKKPSDEIMVKQQSEKPIQMMFWIDRNWEGATIDEINLKKKHKKSSCAVFALQRKIQLLPPSSLNHCRGKSGLNTNVKMQFFTQHIKKPTNVPDFRFMSACPLFFFTEDRQMFRLGLWNFNMGKCDQTGEVLPDYVLTVVNRIKTQIPPSVTLDYSPYVPSLDHHRDTMNLAGWLEKTIGQIFPNEKSIFKVLRTYCRGAWMTLFFFDMHKLYETEDGTNLPPIMALYIVCNTCIIHKVALHDFLTLLWDASTASQTFKPVDTLLTIVRDIIMCFTLCGKEGKYRDDEMMGKVVEDQPFSFAFHEGDNVFDEDDCEGHNQQGSVHIKSLFKHIAKDYATNELRNVRAHINTPANRACLEVGDEAVEVLLRICVQLGIMFEKKILDAILCVGETNFASFSEVVEKKTKSDAPKEGHSFGLLLYREEIQQEIRGARILETTGWGNRIVRPPHHHDDSWKKINHKIQRALGLYMSRQMEEENKILPRMVTNEDYEDRLYSRVITGDNIIFFTQRKNKITYGALLSHISKYSRNYRGESREQVSSWGDIVVLATTPEHFLMALTRADSPWGKWNGAQGKVNDYLHIKKKYPSFHKCLMPPQITEEQFLTRINTLWGKMREEDLIQTTPMESSNHLEFLFSCRVDPSTREYSRKIKILLDLFSEESFTVEARDYMQSKIITMSYKDEDV